jgi:hypothetical protein
MIIDEHDSVAAFDGLDCPAASKGWIDFHDLATGESVTRSTRALSTDYVKMSQGRGNVHWNQYLVTTGGYRIRQKL